jgi:beta-phosphoglucomutase
MGFPQAILFDLYGVVVQTRDYHFQAWARVANDEGVALWHSSWSRSEWL